MALLMSIFMYQSKGLEDRALKRLRSPRKGPPLVQIVVPIGRHSTEICRYELQNVMARRGRGRLDCRAQENLLGLISPEKQGCYEEIRLARLCKSNSPLKETRSKPSTPHLILQAPSPMETQHICIPLWAIPFSSPRRFAPGEPPAYLHLPYQAIENQVCQLLRPGFSRIGSPE
jgi:hypothetical protein